MCTARIKKVLQQQICFRAIYLSLSVYSLPRWVAAFAELGIMRMLQMRRVSMTMAAVNPLQIFQKLRARIATLSWKAGVPIGPRNNSYKQSVPPSS